jgi:hypothetical protein
MHFKKPALENYLFFFPTEACFKNNKRAAVVLPQNLLRKQCGKRFFWIEQAAFGVLIF